MWVVFVILSCLTFVQSTFSEENKTLPPEPSITTPSPDKLKVEDSKPSTEKKFYNLFGVTLIDPFPDYKKVFDEARELILKNYYTGAISEEALYFAAIEGMLRFISPPHKKDHCKILKPEEAKKIERTMQGKTLSIGIKAEFNARDGALTITEVMPESPSDGILETDDRILRIDGKTLKDMASDVVNKMLDGEEGSKVTLTIVRDIAVFDVTVERREFKTPNLKVERLDSGIAYIEIKTITENISEELRDNLVKLKAEGFAKIILDLRNNPGGLLQEGIKLAELFLPEKHIELRIVNQAAPDVQNLVSKNKTPLENFELTILVNKNTASSCEVLAAALQDHKKAKLFGTRTYGKSIIDKLFTLSNQYRLQFTTGSMYSPLGKTWYYNGLTPDIEVQQDLNVYSTMIKIPASQRLTTDEPLKSAYNYLKNIK